MDFKSTILLVLSMLALPIMIVGASSTYFWGYVICNRSEYSKAVFVVDQIKHIRFSKGGGITLAEGKVDGSKESLYAWDDYFKSIPSPLQENQRYLQIMFNPHASDFNFSGKNLRVLSLKQYAAVHQKLFLSIAAAAISPTFWVLYKYREKRLKTKQSSLSQKNAA